MLMAGGGFSGFRPQLVETALGLLWSRHTGTSAWWRSWCPVWTGACYWIWRPSFHPLLRVLYSLARGLATDLVWVVSAFSWCASPGELLARGRILWGATVHGGAFAKDDSEFVWVSRCFGGCVAPSLWVRLGDPGGDAGQGNCLPLGACWTGGAQDGQNKSSGHCTCVERAWRVLEALGDQQSL